MSNEENNQEEDPTTEGSKRQPRTPDFKNDGIAVWINKTKSGREYLNIQLTGHNTIYAYKN